MIYIFSDCELDTNLYALRRGEESVHLRRKVFQLLVYLLKHPGRVVDKDELFKAVWPDQSANNAVLETTMRTVRLSIGDNGREQRIIRTLPGCG